jgi:hypothetical protein
VTPWFLQGKIFLGATREVALIHFKVAPYLGMGHFLPMVDTAGGNRGKNQAFPGSWEIGKRP